jgi:Fic family protein
MRKEAEFHIRFERIHPFNDGNGRTGRIILNHHLLSQGVAPVIIADAMSEEYRKCINDNNVEGLARLFVYSSALQMTNWVSEKKARPVIRRKDIYPKNAELAELVGYDDVEENVEGKNKVFGKGFIF